MVDAITRLMPTNEALEVDHYIICYEGHVKRWIEELEKMQDTKGMLGLVGVGEIGKTTLAKDIYNHLVGNKKFQFMSFLEIDSNLPLNIEVAPSLLSRLQKQLLGDLLHVPKTYIVVTQSYRYWLCKLLNRGRVLIVLDNIYEK